MCAFRATVKTQSLGILRAVSDSLPTPSLTGAFSEELAAVKLPRPSHYTHFMNSKRLVSVCTFRLINCATVRLITAMRFAKDLLGLGSAQIFTVFWNAFKSLYSCALSGANIREHFQSRHLTEKKRSRKKNPQPHLNSQSFSLSLSFSVTFFQRFRRDAAEFKPELKEVLSPSSRSGKRSKLWENRL